MNATPPPENIVELYRTAYRAARRLVSDRQTAEDVAQEAVARALAHRNLGTGYEAAWVTRVATNLVIQQWRRRRLPPNRLGSLESHDLGSASSVDLSRVLRRLPKRQQEVVVLRYIGDWSLDEVAELLGCSVGTVSQHASRGLASLRAALGPTYQITTDPGAP